MMMLISLLVFIALAQQNYNEVQLTMNSFRNGPITAKTPFTKYKLMEDISFQPEVDSLDFTEESFILGFFAALIIATENVEVDLNGYEFSASAHFNYRQRFFSVIQLGSSPFISGAGPADFIGETHYIPAKNVVIKNGVLGMSSHSSIHGNNAIDIKVVNVTMKDFEVSGFHCNGCDGVSLVDVVVGPSLQFVPYNARLSAAQQIVRQCKKNAHKYINVKLPIPDKKLLIEVCNELEAEIEEALNNPHECVSNPHKCQFANLDPTGPDGSAVYGIAIVGRENHGPIIGPMYTNEAMSEDDVELIEWTLADEGETCSSTCLKGCSQGSFLTGADDEVSEGYQHILSSRLGLGCKHVEMFSQGNPSINDEDTCFFSSKASCTARASKYVEGRSLCPCKTGLAHYHLAKHGSTAMGSKCPGGFQNIVTEKDCHEFAETSGLAVKTGVRRDATDPLCEQQGRFVVFHPVAPTNFDGLKVCMRPTRLTHDTPTVSLHRVTVKDLTLAAQEIIHVKPMVGGKPSVVRGPYAGILDFAFMTKDGMLGEYVYNSLSVAKYGLCLAGEFKTCSPELYEPLKKFFAGEETLHSAIETSVQPIGCNGDAMNHGHKGIVGIRLQKMDFVQMEKVIMKDFVSTGLRQLQMHQLKCDQGFQGGDAYGMVVGGVNKITANTISVKHVTSEHGLAAGVGFSGRIPNWDLAHKMHISAVNGAVAKVAETGHLNCPFSKGKGVVLKWDSIDFDQRRCPFAYHDMCENQLC